MTQRVPNIERVRKELLRRVERENMTDIAVNAALPYGWLQQFAYGNIVEPGVTKFMKLAKYLGIEVTNA